MPTSLPLAVPSSVTATVLCPVRSLRSSTSASVLSGRRLESLGTKPALCDLTRATMAASLSMLCEPKMNDTPPAFASAIAIVSLETDCMIAETIGVVISIAGSSCPLRNLTSGVFKETFSGRHSADE